jgi:hypothetical protein
MNETGNPDPPQPEYPPADEDPAHKPSSPQIVVAPVLVRAVEPKTAKAPAEPILTVPGPDIRAVAVIVAVLVAVDVAVLVAVLVAVFVAVFVAVLVFVLVIVFPTVVVEVTVVVFVAVLVIVGLLVNCTAVGVEVAAFDEVGVLEEPHPAIKATGSSAIMIKLPISFFTFTSPEKKFESPCYS